MATATCSDGVINQGEQGVDCGGPCAPCLAIEPLAVDFAGFIEEGPRRYDLYARIKNPNDIHGVKELTYRFLLFGDDQRTAFGQAKGVFFIAPRQERFILLPAIETTQPLKRIELKLDRPQWRRVDDYQKPKIALLDPQLTLEGPSVVLRGTVFNRDFVGFKQIEIIASLLDSREKILAIGRTDVREVEVGEKRDFIIQWPRRTELNSAADYRLQLLTNVLDEDNTFQRFQKEPEPFQRF